MQVTLFKQRLCAVAALLCLACRAQAVRFDAFNGTDEDTALKKSLNTTGPFNAKGFDFSVYQGDVSASSLACLHDHGFSFGIIEAQLGGTYNGHIGELVQRAINNGIHNVDVYVFPDLGYNAESWMQGIMSRLKADGALVHNMIWIDIESGAGWSSDTAHNVEYLKGIINGASGYSGCGASSCVGIYANWNSWRSIMGDDKSFSGVHQIWYPHYDNNPSFSDFESFGGWTHPSIKQYAGTTSICGTEVDYDFY